MIRIAPSVLSLDHANLGPPVRELMGSGADWVHFDVMDGQFVPPITFGAELVSRLRPLGETPFEAHLMTLTPEAHFEDFREAGCTRIFFHPEATPHSHRLAQRLRELGAQAGVAINPGTPYEVLVPLLEVVDAVLVMTVNPGWGGQTLVPETLSKIRRLREAKPELDIEVDGGVSPNTARMLVEAGATTLVAGSYLAGAASFREGIEELRRSCG